MEATTEPQWLDAEERTAWLALVSVAVRLPQAPDAQLRWDAGISHFEYTVLASLSEAEGRTLRMSELAVLADSSLPRLSQVLHAIDPSGRHLSHRAPSTGSNMSSVCVGGWV